MSVYNPGDCVYNPNSINGNNRQILGDVIVQMPLAGAIGAALTTVRKVGAGADGIYAKYHKRMHTDFITVTVVTP